MAKTTSQIIAENQKKRAEAAAVGEQLSKIHERQMAEISGSAAKTQAVLEKAYSGTTDSTKKKDIQRALVSVESSTGSKKKTPSTAREEQIALKNASETTKQKKDRTKYEYDQYVKSDEYKKRLEENDKKAKAEAAAQMFLNPGQPMPQPKVIQDKKEMQLLAAMEQAEKEYNDAEDQKVIEQDLEAITGLSAEERRKLEQYAVGRDVDFYQNLSAAQLGAPVNKAEQDAQELFDKYGYDRINEMANTMSRVSSEKMTQEAAALGQKHGNEHGILSSIGSVGASIAGGLGGTMDYFKELGRNDGRFKTLDPNVIGNLGNVYSGAVRQQVGQNIAGDVYDENGNLIQEGGALRGAAAIGYQGIMSAADSVARAAIGGGAGGAMLAATGTFAQTMSEASKQGATPAQAALLATTTAGIEALSEKIPLDNLIRTAKGQNVGSVIANALRQAGIEATTEEISLLGTVLAEAAILQEKSTYQRDIMTAIMSGVPVDDAIQQASQNIIDEAVNTALVSMISGGASSLGGSAADQMGIFAEEQANNNPEVNKPKSGDVAKSRAALAQKYGILGAEQTAQTKESQQPTTQQQETKPEEQSTAQAAEQPEQAPQQERNLSDTMADVFRGMQENNGKASNRMAETVMSDPAAMQELGITPEGTKAEQRRRVKEEMEKLFQNQNKTTEVSTPTADTQVQSTQERQPANRPQNVDSIDNNAAESSTNVDSKASQPAEMSTNVDKISRNVERSAENTVQQGNTEMQRDRINSVREQQIPVTDPDGRVVSEAAGNIYTSSRTPDSFAPTIRRLVDEGRVSHDVQTNEESLNKAAASIAKDGSIQNALNSIKEVAESGRTGAIDVAKGVLIYDELVNSDDSTHKALAEECFVTLTQLATNTGRPMQLFGLFRNMTPESQAHVLENEVQRNIQKLQKAGTVKKTYQSEIAADLLQEYRNAAEEFQKAKGDEAKKTEEQKMQDIQNVIYLEEAAKLPTTFKAKWDAWRYMAMLGNVKTQFRNVAGNVLMLPYTDAKRAVGAILEKGISKDQRTKAVFVDRQLMKWAKQDTANVRAVLEGSAKLGDSTAKNPLAEDVKTFGDSWIGERFNDMQGIINKAVSDGDMFFKNGEYARSLAGFLKARGYTAADVQNNLVNQDILNEARNYAVNEALKATFNDTNMLSDALANGLRYKGDNPVMKAINMLGEGIMPFRKTPANVVMRFKDYSPAGLVQGMWNLAANVRNGKVTAATALDQIASGLTGTALMQLGYVLAGGIAGVKITGSGADEDEKRQGHQNYALEFSINGQTYSYTIDWASPANLPLFLGANIRAMQEAPDTASTLTAMANAARGALEPLLQLSCLSSLNDMFESARYADEGEGIYAFAARGATNYLTQGIPAIARQTTQAMTENKQTTLVASDDPLIQDAQKAVAGLGVGNAYKTDKVNAWGEVESAGTPLKRALNAFFNPGTLKKIDNSPLEQEISRLNAAGQDVTPDYFAKTVSYIDKDGNGHDDVRLTEEQYQKMAQTQGQTARKLVEDMIKSDSYKAMTDEQKADAINTAYQYARMTGEIAAIEDHTGYDQSWMYDVEKLGAEEIVRRTINSGINTSTQDLKNAWDNGYNEEQFVREMETMFQSYQNAPAKMKRQVYAEATGTAKKYLEVRDKGISHANAIKAIKAVETVKGSGSINKETGKATVRDIDRRQAIARAGLDERTTDILMRAYMADYDPNDESPETTEFKYQYAREELGLSPKEYAATYRAYLDNGKKAQKIAAIRAMGYDYRTANALYKLYYGRMKDDLIEMYG